MNLNINGKETTLADDVSANEILNSFEGDIIAITPSKEGPNYILLVDRPIDRGNGGREGIIYGDIDSPLKWRDYLSVQGDVPLLEACAHAQANYSAHVSVDYPAFQTPKEIRLFRVRPGS